MPLAYNYRRCHQVSLIEMLELSYVSESNEKKSRRKKYNYVLDVAPSQ